MSSRRWARRSETSNTLALFTSDNGFMWGEHELESKGWPYQESIKVPLYIRWPGHVAAGAVDHRLVANIDIAPTIFDAAGVKPGYTVDGRSLLGRYSRPWLLIEWPSEAVHGIPPWWSYVDAKRRYINWSDGWHEYYDNATDPWQMNASNGDRPHSTSGSQRPRPATDLAARRRRCSPRYAVLRLARGATLTPPGISGPEGGRLAFCTR